MSKVETIILIWIMVLFSVGVAAISYSIYETSRPVNYPPIVIHPINITEPSQP